MIAIVRGEGGAGRSGLVSRRVSQTDRRVRFTALTQAGRQFLDANDDKVATAHARTIEVLSIAMSSRVLAFDSGDFQDAVLSKMQYP